MHDPEATRTRPPAPDAAQRTASQAASAMYADDVAARSLGIQILHVSPGFARLSMTIRPDMTNGHGIGHGGFTFLLADTAFAYACNSHNRRAVAAAAAIDFVLPTREGDVLTAEGSEQHLAGRNGLYDVRVSNQRGELVALFRGRSAAIQGRLFEPAAGSVQPDSDVPRSQAR